MSCRGHLILNHQTSKPYCDSLNHTESKFNKLLVQGLFPIKNPIASSLTRWDFVFQKIVEVLPPKLRR
ncbi:hypothetical protein DCC62_30335 [candidate division KSB1 bacterium]|nr:MAG: hypothetical protein DCC62_30335 [candidate division KSB1 bacterium]